MSETWDAIVIGSGPAGMTAAATLAEGGARTLIVDEQPEPGGQIYRGIERNSAGSALARILGAEYSKGASLVARLRRSPAELRLGALVWRIDDDLGVWLRRGEAIERASARTLVIATGAIERPMPVPGWTLPGVMGIGALQGLLKAGGLIPSGHLVLAGSGPLFLLFATQCLAAGVRHLTLLDTSDRALRWSAWPLLPDAMRGHGARYLLKGLGFSMRLKRAAQIYTGVRAISIGGTNRAEIITFDHTGGRMTLPCDTIGLHNGVIPEQHVGRSIGCSYRFNAGQSAFMPRTMDCATDRPGIYVAGDAGGIVGAAASAHEGTIAALHILKHLRLLSAEVAERRLEKEKRDRKAHLSVRPLLDHLYPARAVDLPAADTIVCRCEAITAEAIRTVIGQGACGPNQVKAFLRCGMGPCQGRMCGPTVSALIADQLQATPEEVGYYRVRSPLKPVRIGQLIGKPEGQKPSQS